MFRFAFPIPANRSCGFSHILTKEENPGLYACAVNPRDVDAKREFVFTAIANTNKNGAVGDVRLLQQLCAVSEAYIAAVDAMEDIMRKNGYKITLSEDALVQTAKHGICRWSGSKSLRTSNFIQAVTEEPFFCLGFEKSMVATVCSIAALNIGEIHMKNGTFEDAALYFSMVLIYVEWTRAFIRHTKYASLMPEMNDEIQYGIAAYAAARGTYAVSRHLLYDKTISITNRKTAALYSYLCDMVTIAHDCINRNHVPSCANGLAMVAQFLRMEYLSRAHQYTGLMVLSNNDKVDNCGRTDLDSVDFGLAYNLMVVALIFSEKAKRIAEAKKMDTVKKACLTRQSNMEKELLHIKSMSSVVYKNFKMGSQESLAHMPFMFLKQIPYENMGHLLQPYLELNKKTILDSYTQ